MSTDSLPIEHRATATPVPHVTSDESERWTTFLPACLGCPWTGDHEEPSFFGALQTAGHHAAAF